MAKNIKVSIVIPIYNVEKYLERCVNSVKEQTYKNLEIILVDDGSPDACPQMCDGYAKTDDRIKVIHKKNGGLMAAWIDGVKSSTGEYVYFVDSDDWLEKDSVQNYVDKLVENKNIDLIINTFFKSTDTTKIKQKGIGYSGEKLFTGDDLNLLKDSILNKSMLFHFYRWNKIFKRDLILNNLKFCDTRINVLEDMNISLGAMLDANCVYIMDNPGYNYYVRTNSMIREPFKPQLIKNYEYVLEALVNLLNNKNYETTNYLKKQSVWLLVGLADRVIRAKCNNKQYFDQIYESKLWQNDLQNLPLTAVTKIQTIAYNLFIKKRYFLFVLFRRLGMLIRKLKK